MIDFKYAVVYLLFEPQLKTAEFLGVLETILLKSGSLKVGDTVVMISGSTKLRGADYIMKIHDLGQ